MAARAAETILAMVFAVLFGGPDEAFVYEILVGLQPCGGKVDALAGKAHHGAHFFLQEWIGLQCLSIKSKATIPTANAREWE
jgi:hypothetical protein